MYSQCRPIPELGTKSSDLGNDCSKHRLIDRELLPHDLIQIHTDATQLFNGLRKLRRGALHRTRDFN